MTSQQRKILILGVTGMLGHALFRNLSARNEFDVYGTARSANHLSWFSPEAAGKIYTGVEADAFDSVAEAVSSVNPDTLINCVGVIKQSPQAGDPVQAITLNALLPHRIAAICGPAGVRMIHMSTDCVFDGKKGMYREEDLPNADDLYGRTKLLGEVTQSKHCITIRSSIIGHELKGERGLIEWFLAQEQSIKGFTHALYSGFTTVEFSRVIADYVIPNPELRGLFHVASEPISKYDLLKRVAERYGKDIRIEPYGDIRLDRSLDASLFRRLTGYRPPSWADMIDMMYRDFQESREIVYRKERGYGA